MDKLGTISLALFFTRGVSLRGWDRTGMLDREVALYRKLQGKGVKISFVTYGGKEELRYREQLPGVNILCNRWNLKGKNYERFIPFLHATKLRKAGIFKSNQINGADIALRAANLWKKPFIARGGYMWSEFVGRRNGKNSYHFKHARSIEDEVFSNAQKVVVTTAAMQNDIEKRVVAARGKTVVIPNYVATDIFAPDSDPEKDFDLVFVGRLSKQKNIAGLLEAISGLKLSLLLVGQGELGEELHKKFGNMDGRLQWMKRVANKDLPKYLNRAKIFILPSFYEGHPKTLIEAMSCGMAVIGADSPGIRELIRHGENGWLCGTKPESIRAEIQTLLGRPDLCRKIGKSAREFVVEHYTLDRIVEEELNLYHRTLS